MFFHNKPGWRIFFQVFLVLLLIAGVFAVSRVAYYKGYARGTQVEGKELVGYYGKDNPMDYHHKNDYMPQMGYVPQKGYMPQNSYPGGMHYPSRVGFFGGGALHFILGILGLIVLVKIIMGFSGMSMYRRRMMHGHPDGKRYPMYPPFFHNPYHCPCCSGDVPEEDGPETVEEKKTKKK